MHTLLALTISLLALLPASDMPATAHDPTHGHQSTVYATHDPETDTVLFWRPRA